MKNAIRCCLSCILPCGALDVIRIVHANGRVEEISGTVKAAEIMKLHPKHVLKKPFYPSAASEEGGHMRPKIAVVPPDADLKRGKIYFLMPLPPPTPEKSRPRPAAKRKDKESPGGERKGGAARNRRNNVVSNLVISDCYLSEILSERVSTRRRGRVGFWRPHLESISEIPVEA
ncbi:Unknown protein [Striga hermonthica]|uniref:Uncharacterized protein n=1 Tax=Striga hermonthica TaxID=68872 RepID=A0A9N7NNM6_STRHE|nr:Unknown protein [Striga hermonthica]